MKVSLLTDTVEVAIGAVPKSEARQSLSELLKLPRARRTAEQLKLIADHLYSFGMCASHSTARSPRRCKPASIAGPLPRPCRCFSSAHAGPCGACMPCGAAGPCAGGGMQLVTIARPILCRMRHLPAEVRAQVAAVALLTVYPPSSIVSTDKQACTVTLLASPRLHSTPHTGAHARAHTQLKTTAPPLRPVHSRYAPSAKPTHLYGAAPPRRHGIQWCAGKVRSLRPERAVPGAGSGQAGARQTVPAAHRRQFAVRRAHPRTPR